MSARRLHRYGTFALSLAMVVIGCALLVQGASTSALPRALLGALFVAAGCLRVYVEVRRKRGA
jgi:uncharacterized membrane protein HdeD (DUF308 family)